MTVGFKTTAEPANGRCGECGGELRNVTLQVGESPDAFEVSEVQCGPCSRERFYIECARMEIDIPESLKRSREDRCEP